MTPKERKLAYALKNLDNPGCIHHFDICFSMNRRIKNRRKWLKRAMRRTRKEEGKMLINEAAKDME